MPVTLQQPISNGQSQQFQSNGTSSRTSTAVPVATSTEMSPWTTPRRLQLALVCVGIATLILFFTVQGAVSQMHYAVKTVGQDSAPSVIAAQQIRSGLANMDADVANELIAPPGKDGSELAAYELHRKQVTDSLVAAAENITYGDAERVPIRTMEEGLGQYEAYVAQARVFHKRGGDPQVLPSYHQATQIMHTVLLPSADALDKANDGMLETVYERQRTENGELLTSVWVAGLFVIAVLLAIQAYLARSMRRLINLPLALATLIVAGFLLAMTSELSRAAADLKGAKQDAYDSVHALWQATAIAYDANAAESRWLLDPGYASQSSREFFDNANQLMTLPQGYTFDMLVSLARDGHLPQACQGHFATELRNITFPGEQNAALSMLQTFGAYYNIDGQIRALQNSGRHADAVALCVGAAPGQSDWAFDQFDQALKKVRDINENYLGKYTASANGDISGGIVIDSIVCVLVFALSAAGLIVRLREYTV